MLSWRAWNCLMTYPDSYQEAYGLKQLRDAPAPDLLEADEARVWREAEESVKRVRELIFPIHGMEAAES